MPGPQPIGTGGGGAYHAETLSRAPAGAVAERSLGMLHAAGTPISARESWEEGGVERGSGCSCRLVCEDAGGWFPPLRGCFWSWFWRGSTWAVFQQGVLEMARSLCACQQSLSTFCFVSFFILLCHCCKKKSKLKPAGRSLHCTSISPESVRTPGTVDCIFSLLLKKFPESLELDPLTGPEQGLCMYIDSRSLCCQR
ncbi:uncharacterized protein LJ264_016573 isoform 1-T1 [Porphyrio hochstetteri]